jgi:rhodanese-related sulfurtransferase/plastocyanin
VVLLALISAPFVAVAGDDAARPVILISPQLLIERLQAGENIVFVDVRQPEEYAPAHIPGALNIPSGEIQARRAELPRDATLIPYCNMDFRGFVAARALQKMGFEHVALMQERGIQGWISQKLPVAGTQSGVTDAAALERVRHTPPDQLLGERFVRRVAASGRSREIPVKMDEWYFQPNELEVAAGDEVRLTVTSAKGEHYFVLPDYEIQERVPEHETRQIVFVADRAGTFKFGSCEWDGSALQVMKGQLQVKPASSADAR